MLERLKSALLVLLFCTLILQLAMSLNMGVQGQITLKGLFTESAAPAAPAGRQDPQTAAWPLRMAVISGEGVYAPWTREEYDALYQQVSGILSEAIGSCSREGEEITQSRYVALLESPGLFFGYDGALPFSLHRAWTESEPHADQTPVRNILLNAWEGEVRLALTDGETYFLYSTASREADLLALTQGYATNARFAAGAADFAHLAPDELVYPGQGTLPAYRLSRVAASGQVNDDVLEALGMNPNLAGDYTSAGGDVIYVDGSRVLALRREGALEYTNTADLPQDRPAPPAGRELAALGAGYCESVRQAVTAVWQQTGGMGSLSLSLYRYEKESDSWYFSFEMLVGGCPVILERAVAYATVQGGIITALSVTPYSLEEEGSRSLPAYLMAAAAGGAQTRLLLCYQGEGEDLVVPVLCRQSEAGR